MPWPASVRTGLIARLVRAVGHHWIPQSEVRAEAWSLGARHRGEVLLGARTELGAPGLSVRRAVLLKAVIRSLTR